MIDYILKRSKRKAIALYIRNGGLEVRAPGFDGERFYMPPNLTLEQIKDVCVQIYHFLAKQHLTERTFTIAQKMNVTPIAVKINSTRTRWGSCSAKKHKVFMAACYGF